MIVFDRFAPAPLLRPFIRCYQYLAHPGGPGEPSSQLIAPDGSPELNFCMQEPVLRFTPNGGAPQKLSGMYLTNRASRHYFIKRTGPARFMSVLFQPGSLSRFTPFPAGLVADATVPATEVFGRSVISLLDVLSAAPDTRTMIEQMDGFWSSRIMKERASASTLQAVVHAIQYSHGTVAMGQLAARSGSSIRQIEQLFDEHMGTSPRTFSRLVRFRRALRIIARKPHLPLATIAPEIGYFDQSHLWRDFKSFTGSGPRGYGRQAHALNDAMIKLFEPAG